MCVSLLYCGSNINYPIIVNINFLDTLSRLVFQQEFIFSLTLSCRYFLWEGADIGMARGCDSVVPPPSNFATPQVVHLLTFGTIRWLF